MVSCVYFEAPRNDIRIHTHPPFIAIQVPEVKLLLPMFPVLLSVARRGQRNGTGSRVRRTHWKFRI